MYPIIEVPHGSEEKIEQLGTKRKFWFRAADGVRYLFKEGRPTTGENWAEKVSCEIAQRLVIPHASYDLATWKGLKGVATKTLVPYGARMVFANELLARVVKEYDLTVYRPRQYTITVAHAIVRSSVVNGPINYTWPIEGSQGAGVFVGYLMLDALVSNQDRHHENWGLILTADRRINLSPTYDHAASLGRNESDDARRRRLTTTDQGGNVAKYCNRSKSAFYLTPGSQVSMSTMDAFAEIAKIEPAAAKYWLGRLAAVTDEDFENIFAQIPAPWISIDATNFALKMLEINRTGLLRFS